MVTVLLLVVLRLTLGWHFLYEGVWKIKHPDQFAAEAEGFLTGARGPMAGMFYAMVPDIDGRQRLEGKLESVEEVVKDDKGNSIKDAKGKEKTEKKPVVRNEARTAQWEASRDQLAAKHADCKDEAEKVCASHLAGPGKVPWPELAGHPSLFRLPGPIRRGQAGQPEHLLSDQARLGRHEGPPHRSQGLARLSLTPGKRHTRRRCATCCLATTRIGTLRSPADGTSSVGRGMEQIAFAITWGLTALGACLMLGLCTRLAALGGGVFMLFVVMSQPSYPGRDPARSAAVGPCPAGEQGLRGDGGPVPDRHARPWGAGAGWTTSSTTCVVNPFLSKTIYRKKKEG